MAECKAARRRINYHNHEPNISKASELLTKGLLAHYYKDGTCSMVVRDKKNDTYVFGRTNKDGKIIYQLVFNKDGCLTEQSSWYDDGTAEAEAKYEVTKDPIFDVSKSQLMSKRLWYKNGHLDYQIRISSEINEKEEWYESGTKYRHYFIFKNLSNKLVIITLNDEKGRDCILPLGDITVWKACQTPNKTNVYVKLLVPKKSGRINPLSKIMGTAGRIEYGKVLQIIDKDGKEYKEAESCRSQVKCRYILNEMVYADKFDADIRNDYGHGIYVEMYPNLCDQWFNKQENIEI